MIKTELFNPSRLCFDLDDGQLEIFIIYKGQKYKVNKSLLMYYLKSFGLVNLQAGDDEDEDS